MICIPADNARTDRCRSCGKHKSDEGGRHQEEGIDSGHLVAALAKSRPRLWRFTRLSATAMNAMLRGGVPSQRVTEWNSPTGPGRLSVWRLSCCQSPWLGSMPPHRAPEHHHHFRAVYWLGIALPILQKLEESGVVLDVQVPLAPTSTKALSSTVP